jgi:hypothetical protein
MPSLVCRWFGDAEVRAFLWMWCPCWWDRRLLFDFWLMEYKSSGLGSVFSWKSVTLRGFVFPLLFLGTVG